MWLKNWVCHTHLKFKIEKGMAGISYEPHPHNFQNLYNFWRCINVINIIFWYFCSVLIFKNSQWVIRPCTSVVLVRPNVLIRELSAQKWATLRFLLIILSARSQITSIFGHFMSGRCQSVFENDQDNLDHHFPKPTALLRNFYTSLSVFVFIRVKSVVEFSLFQIYCIDL